HYRHYGPFLVHDFGVSSILRAAGSALFNPHFCRLYRHLRLSDRPVFGHVAPPVSQILRRFLSVPAVPRPKQRLEGYLDSFSDAPHPAAAFLFEDQTPVRQEEEITCLSPCGWSCPFPCCFPGDVGRPRTSRSFRLSAVSPSTRGNGRLTA